MRKIIHGIDVPLFGRSGVRLKLNAINDRVSQCWITVLRINLESQGVSSFAVYALPHLLKQFQ